VTLPAEKKNKITRKEESEKDVKSRRAMKNAGRGGGSAETKTRRGEDKHAL
jgi:hypothetical protein